MKKIKVLGIQVSPLSKLNDNGAMVEIGPDDYKHREGFFPSRQVNGTYKGRKFHLATIEEVPKVERKPPEKKDDGGRRVGEDDIDLYKDRGDGSEDLMVLVDGDNRIVFLNKQSPEVKQYFLASGLRENDLPWNSAKKMYERIKQIALGILDATVSLEELGGNIKIPDSLTDDDAIPQYHDNAYDWTANRVVREFFHNNADMQVLKEKIDNWNSQHDREADEPKTDESGIAEPGVEADLVEVGV